jgi:hypothetical protein
LADVSGRMRSGGGEVAGAAARGARPLEGSRNGRQRAPAAGFTHPAERAPAATRPSGCSDAPFATMARERTMETAAAGRGGGVCSTAASLILETLASVGSNDQKRGGTPSCTICRGDSRVFR